MKKQILYCRCKADVFEPKRQEQIEKALREVQAKTYALDDLCALCALDKSKIKSLFNFEGDTMIVACNQRSVKSLLSFAGVENRTESMEYFNILESETEVFMERIADFCGVSAQGTEPESVGVKSDWPSWYPVLDYDRCVACGQCADFCLFGTYDRSGGHVAVVNPQACKNNCPACARICPEAAIIFPKYTEGGAISGTENINEEAEHERMRKDVDQILGSDIYKALEKRKAKRRRLISREAMSKAVEEREKALQKTDKRIFRFDPSGDE